MLRELKNDYDDNLIRDDIKQYFTNYTGKPIYEVNNEGPDAARKRGPDAYFKDVVRRVCISLFDIGINSFFDLYDANEVDDFLNLLSAFLFNWSVQASIKSWS